jgi:type II secretion system protein G
MRVDCCLTRSRGHCRPAAFTLIELLVVIVILGILVGLLVPAVMNAVVTAKNATVSAEIQALSQGLAQFKQNSGDFPPSRILVSENGDYSTATIPAALQPLGRRSVLYLKKFWPRMVFNTGSSANPTPTPGNPSGIGISGGWYDVNGNGNLDGFYVLSGPQCLVLFLGGVPQTVGTAGWAMTGFAKNPLNPFMNSSLSTNRQPPFYDFPSNRLTTDLTNTAGPSSGFPGFLDSLGTYDTSGADGAIPFYVYFSSYGGVGYDPGDCDMNETDVSTSAKMIGAFVATNAASSLPSALAFPGGIQSPAPNPYTNGPPVPTQQNGNIDTGAVRPRVWQNAQSYQIIAAGHDRVFGIGGQYVATGSDHLPFVNAQTTQGYISDSFQTIQANAQATNSTLNNDARQRESDNLTNFSQGKLQ